MWVLMKGREWGTPVGIAHSSLSTWHTKLPVPEPPLKDVLLAKEVITLMVTGLHTGYQSTLPMSYISNLAVTFSIMCLYEDVSVLWCVYRGQKITFRSWLSPFTVQYRDQIQVVRLGQSWATSPAPSYHFSGRIQLSSKFWLILRLSLFPFCVSLRVFSTTRCSRTWVLALRRLCEFKSAPFTWWVPGQPEQHNEIQSQKKSYQPIPLELIAWIVSSMRHCSS